MLTDVFSRWNRLAREEQRMPIAQATRSRPQGKTFLADGKLRAQAGGAVELAFNHDNSDVIMETNVAAETCRAVKDLDRELFRRE